MPRPLTVERLDYPPHIRALDRLAGLLARTPASLGQLDRRTILNEARQRTGLSDWGDDAFLEPMEVILDNARSAGFTELAKVFARQTFVKAVMNRLRLQRARSLDPMIDATRITRPIFVLGFPRSGTTLLQNLLAKVPGRRGLAFWELVTPMPVDVAHPDLDARRRMRTADLTLKAGYLMAPEMAAVHEVRAETLEECWYLFANNFAVLNQDLISGLSGFGRWLMTHDMTGPYADYKLWLQALVRQRPAEHLVLKCPEHLWFVDALLEVFPDAAIVWTHRDPAATIASYCSLVTLPRRMLYGAVDPHEVGRYILERFHEGTERAMAARQAADPSRFHDVAFADLVRDPHAVVKGIHEHFGLSHPPGTGAAIDRHLATKRADARGQHVYSAERYGLDPDEIHERFAGYLRRFDVPTRPPR